MRETMTALPWSSLDAVERAYRELEAENARLREALKQIALTADLGCAQTARAALNPGEKP